MEKIISTAYRELIDHYNFVKKDKKPLSPINDKYLYYIDRRVLERYFTEKEGGVVDFKSSYLDIVPHNFSAIINIDNDITIIHVCVIENNEAIYKLSGSIAKALNSLNDSGESVANRIFREIATYLYKMMTSKETVSATKEFIIGKKTPREKVVPLTIFSSKKYLQSDEKHYGEKLDWKHSWRVIGHWRTIKGIGKNRDGNYGVFGKTWVNPCIKGSGDLVEKVRVLT